MAVIRLNGKTVQTSPAWSYLGESGYVVVQWLTPGTSQPLTAYHTVQAGGYYALGMEVTGDMTNDFEQTMTGASRAQAETSSHDPAYSDSTTGAVLSGAAFSYLNHVQAERAQIASLFSATSVTGFTEDMTEINPEFYWVDPGGPGQELMFRPQGWANDNEFSAETIFADNGDDSGTPVLLTMDGLDASIREARLWDQATGIPSISTVTGFQLANSTGVPIDTIDESNIDAVTPTMNITPDVISELYYEVDDLGFTVTIPANTLTMNEWSGSVWISENASTGQFAYYIAGGINGSSTTPPLFGGTTTQLAHELSKNQNPTCSDLNDYFDQYSGKENPNFDRAVAFKESNWRQFDDPPPAGDGTPNWDPGTDVGIMQVNEDVWEGQTVKQAGGTPITENDFQLENDAQFNVQFGAAILNMDIRTSKSYLSGLHPNPSSSDLIAEAYYIYNHGSNVPPGFAYDANGKLTAIPYEAGDTFTYKGKTRTVTEGVLDAQSNALAVQNIFDNQTWVNGQKGCQ
ncbi:MAG: hypothetical protein ACRD4X_06630 [Candidatus Acidiferrales bacterium]